MIPASVAGSSNLAARRRAQERALEQLLLDATLLEFALEEVWLLFVYVQKATLVGKFADKRIQVRIEYGDDMGLLERATNKVRTVRDGDSSSADFDVGCVFPYRPDLVQRIGFRVLKLGFIDRTIASVAMRQPLSEASPGIIDEDLVLLGKQGEDGLVGQLSVALELRPVPRHELQFDDRGFGIPTRPVHPLDDRGFGIPTRPVHPQTVFVPMAQPRSPMATSQTGHPVVIGEPTNSSLFLPSRDTVIGDPVIGAYGGRPNEYDGGGLVAEQVERTWVDASGVTHHEIITRHPDGREERITFQA